MRSPAINDNVSAKLALSVRCALPETFTFSHKTSTEEGDVLELTINSKEVGSWSGISEWEQSTFELKEGQNVIIFSFKKNAQGSGGEDGVMIDHLLFPPMEELVVYAGDDAEICSNEPFTPNSCVLHPEEILWTTNGDGTFDDPSLEQPSYTFGIADKQSGQVVLSMTVTDVHNTTQSDDLSISLIEDLSEITPEEPSGDTLIDLRLISISDYNANISSDYDIVWSLEPEEAGTLIMGGNMANIVWNSDFRGNATLTYTIGNTCGDSEASMPMNIQVLNTTGITETADKAIEVYPNPAGEQVRVKAIGLEGEVTIRIIDVLGRVMLENNVVASGSFEAVIDTSTLRSGLYDIQVINNGTTRNSHLLIK